MVLLRTRRWPLFRAFQYPGFTDLWLNGLFSSIGLWFETITIGWLVVELTGSPFVLGFVIFLRGAPLVVLAPFGGVIADRVDRRKLIAAVMGANGLVGVVLAVLAATGQIAVWHLAVDAVIAGVSTGLLMPGRQALTYDLVGKEGLTNALSLGFIANSLTRIAGPAAGGVIIATAGTAACFALMAGAWTISGVLVLRIPAGARNPRAVQPPQGGALRDLAAGLRYVRRSPVLPVLLLSEIMADGFGFSAYTLFPVFAESVLEVGPEGLGLLIAAPGVGALAATVGSGWLGHRLHGYRGRMLLAGLVVFGSALVAFSSARWFPLALALLIVAGGAASWYDIFEVTCLQNAVSDDMRGRVMGLYVLTWSMTNVGSLGSGAIATLLGAPLAVAASGTVLAGYGLLVAGRCPQVWHIEVERRLSEESAGGPPPH